MRLKIKMNLKRLQSFEDGFVKYALEDPVQDVLATLIYSNKFNDEMEIRISKNNNRFSVRGHKSIMDKLSINEVKALVEKHIQRGDLELIA